jgi:DNA-binding HxlR family transcriptional regulator
VRALDPTGKDRALLQAIRDPKFCISGLCNRDLRELLAGKNGYKDMDGKQLSAKMSRQLRLLRDHGLIRKLPRQKRYLVTHKGHELTTSLDALLAASAKQLMDIAA